MFYKSTIIGEIISSIFGYFKISNTINEDGSKTRLEYEDIGRYKQLAFRCKSGSNVYECNYEGTMIQKTSFIISAITAAALAVYLMKHKVSNKGL